MCEMEIEDTNKNKKEKKRESFQKFGCDLYIININFFFGRHFITSNEEKETNLYLKNSFFKFSP